MEKKLLNRCKIINYRAEQINKTEQREEEAGKNYEKRNSTVNWMVEM